MTPRPMRVSKHDGPGESTIRLGFIFERPAPGEVGRKRRRIRKNNKRKTKRSRLVSSTPTIRIRWSKRDRTCTYGPSTADRDVTRIIRSRPNRFHGADTFLLASTFYAFRFLLVEPLHPSNVLLDVYRRTSKGRFGRWRFSQRSRRSRFIVYYWDARIRGLAVRASP